MKIYFIGQKGIPAKFGGVEKHVEELATRLVKAGHQTFVYTRPNYTDPKLKSFRRINLISLPTIATKHLDAIVHTFRASLDIRKRQVDLIHFHSIGPSSLIWLVKLLKPGVPVIATFHTKCYEHQKWGILARLYLKFGEMITCLLADKTIVVSEDLVDYVKNKYQIEPVYIPNGVTLHQPVRAKKIKHWGLDKNNYFLSVSRLVKHKGIHYLIIAYLKLKTKKKLVITGDGVYTDSYVRQLKQLAQNHKNIIFTGNQTGRTLAELYDNAYLFIQPSESEGLSISLLEAMSYQKCVLTSDIAENKVVVKDIGYLFKNKSISSLKNKLVFLLKHSAQVKKAGQLAKQKVRKDYNWDKIVKQTIKVYKEVGHNFNFVIKPAKLGLAKRLINFLF